MKERGIIFNGAMVRAILSGKKTQTRRIMKQQPPERWSPVTSSGEPDIQARTYTQGVVDRHGCLQAGPQVFGVADEEWGAVSPFGQPGDRLWVRENWHQRGEWRKPAWPDADWDDAYWSGTKEVMYMADSESPGEGWRGRPSIHMPRWASRILLEITDVRVERLNDISEEDADAEGCERLDSEREERDWTICPKCGGTGLHDALGTNYGVVHDVDCRQCDTYAKRFSHLWQSIYGQESWDSNPWVWIYEFKKV